MAQTLLPESKIALTNFAWTQYNINGREHVWFQKQTWTIRLVWLDHGGDIMDTQNIFGISLFSGGGGLDIGFEQAGFKILFTTDIDAICCQTLTINKGNTLSDKMDVVQADIWDLDLEQLPKNVDFVIGGPPCQTFSASGRRAGGAPGRLDDRGSLFEGYCRVIEKTNPRVFLFENVRGILGTNHGNDFKDIIKAFSGLGYQIDYRILDAEDYGVAQQRERMFVVGHKLGREFLFPRPLLGPDSRNKKPHISVKKAIEDLPFTEVDRRETFFGNGKYTDLLPLVPPGSNYLHFTAKRGYPAPIFAYRSRFSDFLYKANPDTPVKTLIASPGKYTGPLHWENRYLTVSEYMRIQGFPDGHIFAGNRADQLRQIGNSVCPKVALALALSIKQQVFEVDCGLELMDSTFKLSFDKRKGEKAQKTRAKHSEVENCRTNDTSNAFRLFDYTALVDPSTRFKPENVIARVVDDTSMSLSVYSDAESKLAAQIHLVVNSGFYNGSQVNLHVSLYGNQPFCIQTMWNAIDDWVKRTSSFHSIMELYGHFTEPHPIFKIVSATMYSNMPICRFAAHYMNFKHCSVYYKKEYLLSMWQDAFGINEFGNLAKELRRFRYDIRCHETNVAIPEDVYMVAYPFTLPYDKQMNFSIKES
jgi:DNA (cytosine-5)-methyltransferase 1